MSKVLTLEQMKRMSPDEITNAYRNGYKLSECKTCGERHMMGLNPASCPASIVQGTTKTLTMTVTTDGTPPYIPKFYVDGVQKTISATWDSVNKRFTFPWTFSETVASHTYATEITDSCVTGTKTSNRDTCTVSITTPIVCTIPVVKLTIPA